MDLFPDANTKIAQGALDNYYNIDATQWSLYGFNGADPLGLGFNVTSFYIPALMEEYAPVAYSDTKNQSVEVFTGIPSDIIPDSLDPTRLHRRHRRSGLPVDEPVRNHSRNGTDVVHDDRCLAGTAVVGSIFLEARNKNRWCRVDCIGDADRHCHCCAEPFSLDLVAG